MKRLFLFAALFGDIAFGSVPPGQEHDKTVLLIDAEKGDPDSQYRVSLYYSNGSFGFNKDPVLFAHYLKAAADNGKVEAQVMVGLRYLCGIEVEKKPELGYEYLRKAALQDNAEGLYLTALCCFDGNGRNKNKELGVDLLKKAIEKNYKKAYVRLAECYMRGEGVIQNLVTAKDLAEKGLDNNDLNSVARLAYLNQDSDTKYSYKLYMKAACAGHAFSMYKIACSYFYGWGVIKNYEEALKWAYITKANESGLSESIKANNSDIISALEASLDSSVSADIRNKARTTMNAIDNKSEPEVEEPSLKQAGSKTLRTGSGVLVSKNGLVVTAAHVIAECQTIKIISGGTRATAKIISVDEKNDVALLQAEGGPYEASPLDMSGDAPLGSRVFTVGFPHVDIQGTSPKMTRGEISSNSGMRDDPTCWQVSVPVQMGNSGGGLFDEAGNVVGVIVGKVDAVTSAMKAGDSFQNVNYAVKGEYLAPLLRKYARELISAKKESSRLKDEDVVNQATKSAVLIICE